MRDEKEYIDKVIWDDDPYLVRNGLKEGLITLPKGQKASVIVGRNEDGYEHVSIQLFCDRITQVERNVLRKRFILGRGGRSSQDTPEKK